MKICAYNVIMGCTNKCGFRCRHCLRGPARNESMSEEVIEQIFKVFDLSQTAITFGGGEITLGLDVLESFVEKLTETGLNSFYVVSNGKTYKEKLVKLLDKLYYIADEKELCGLAFSHDEFHEEFISKQDLMKNIDRYRWWEDEYYGECYEREYIDIHSKFTDFSIISIINEGRAKKLYGYKKRELTEDPIVLSCYQDENLWIQEGMFYINYNGDVFTVCDASYETMSKRDKFFIGNIFDEDFIEKVKDIAIEEE